MQGSNLKVDRSVFDPAYSLSCCLPGYICLFQKKEPIRFQTNSFTPNGEWLITVFCALLKNTQKAKKRTSNYKTKHRQRQLSIVWHFYPSKGLLCEGETSLRFISMSLRYKPVCHCQLGPLFAIRCGSLCQWSWQGSWKKKLNWGFSLIGTVCASPV